MSFQSYGIDNGLSQGFVSDIVQDNKGFMWFATGDGLNRYDGYNFVVYHHEPDHANTLISDDLTCVYQDVKGRIWIGTRNSGIDLFNPETNTFEHFHHTDGPSLHSNSILQISGDESGAIWIKTRDGIERIQLFAGPAASRTKGSTKVPYHAEFIPVQIDRQTELHKKKSAPQGLFIDSRNRIFITTTDKIWQVFFNAKTNKYKLTERYKFASSDNAFVPQLLEDKAGKRLLLNNRDIIQFADYEFNDPKKIYSYDAYQIRTVIDREQNLWLSNNNKITLLNLKTGNVQNLISNIPDQSLAISAVTDFYCDKTGVVWIGSGGYGLLKYDPEAELFHHIFPGEAVYQLLTDQGNNIYT
ncbi:two-component regulator propeller domain-containing protein, partial [Pedobacter sp. HMWF019]|uniref:ligand-binding sensor domain-containing protein n=1 Tax=Pedobacter sp. HMWF019 TaxID=2056856 RepID=UPI0018EE4AD6